MMESTAFILTIEDNGRGFVLEQLLTGTPGSPPRPGTGNGLANMRQRLAAIGGWCEIESMAGKGTRVTFTVALKGFPA
jgi:signal transduction histidine kinase